MLVLVHNDKSLTKINEVLLINKNQSKQSCSGIFRKKLFDWKLSIKKKVSLIKQLNIGDIKK